MSSIFLEKSVPELMQAVANGSLSFKDMADTTARYIEQEEAHTKAWVCYDLPQLQRASEQAHQKYLKRGKLLGLDGIPFGVKDIFNTSAFPTEMGSTLWKGYTPGNDARLVSTLLAAGGLVAGKTVTAEFAVHALNETLNPHDASKTPGTSSSGSAAAVAAGMVPFALGSQTAGSIIRPASFCGVWGMKPSFGLIPRTGVLKTTDSLDTLGFLAAHGASLRTILDHTRVKGPDYPFVFKHVDMPGNQPKPSGRPWRVGFVKTHTWDGATDYAKDAVTALAKRIGSEPGFTIEEIKWPDMLHAAHAIHATLYAKSLSYYFKNEATMMEKISPVMSQMIAEGEAISPEAFRQALVDQEAVCAELETLFAPYDFVLSLGTSSSAPPRGDVEIPDPSLLWTLGHLPAVGVPTFRCPAGLPLGVQFTARKWNDYALLQGIEELIERGILPAGSQPVHRSA